MGVSLLLFLIPMLAGLTAQALKPWLNPAWYREMEQPGRKLPRYGGMPSAHAAFGTSLVTVVGWTDGLMSGSFAIASAFLVYLLDDALRRRLFLGRYGIALRMLTEALPPARRQRLPYLETHLGHTPLEVLAGMGLGFGLSLILLYGLSSWIGG